MNFISLGRSQRACHGFPVEADGLQRCPLSQKNENAKRKCQKEK